MTELANATSATVEDATALVAAATDDATYAVDTSGLTKRYGTLNAVDDVALRIPRGSIFGLIGPNGAGKSTTFSMIATLLRPTSGSLSVLGHDPARAPREVRRQLGYMPDVL